MGAVANFVDYKNRTLTPHQRLLMQKATQTGFSSGDLISQWLATGFPEAGSVPSGGGTVVDRNTPGTFQQQNPDTNQLFLAQMEACYANGGYHIVYDRLVHDGGHPADTSIAQATASWPALTRYTSGQGVMMAAEIYTQIGATPTTLTVGYTNQSGTSGRTTQPVVFGGTGEREAGRFIILPLQEGDTGVRSVQTFQLAGSTGTAGNYGIVLFKPLFALPAATAQFFSQMKDGLFGGTIPEIQDDAGLALLFRLAFAGSGAMSGELRLIEA